MGVRGPGVSVFGLPTKLEMMLWKAIFSMEDQVVLLSYFS